MNHKGTVLLETDRLILRRFCIEDADAMFRNWANDVEVTKYLTWPAHSDVSVSKTVINSWLGLYQKINHYSWTIVLKEIDEPIGSIAAVEQRDDIGMVHIGYCIGRKWWRCGYASEALIRLVRFFFDDVGANRIETRHDPRNPNSGKVMQKAGLRYEGIFRDADINNQGVCDAARYAILADDFYGGSKTIISVVPYVRKYRDDMLYCFLAAKDAIGNYAPDPQWSKPALKDDLLDIDKYYYGRGDVFYLAVDERDRVAGMVGTETTSPTELWLKRLFVKPELKNTGVGSKLLSTVEEYAAGKGICVIHTRFAHWYREAAVFYPAKGFVEAERCGYLTHMMKRLK
jgi:ribosomal-protein-alanine N-acetyltransferase